jgi:UDP-N-acetyl-D-glucosamine dehydrogenase
VRNTAILRRRILAREASVTVVGQGYVGLSLACAAAEAGFRVSGVDIDADRIEDLGRALLSVPGVAETAFRRAVDTGRLTFGADLSPVVDSDVVCICVPTPMRDGAPDLTYVETAVRGVADHLRPGRLVVLESTTYPGTTDGPVREILQSNGLRAGQDFLLAYSPERIDPGNEEFEFGSIPRIVGGLTPESTGMASLFYGQLVDKVLVVESCRAAELAKLLENTFRHINIALVNEMAMICHRMGINTWDVLDAAATKPFGYMPFYPGPGVGGNCIPVDPMYLAWQVRRDAGFRFRLLEQAQEVNDQMPAYVADRIAEALNDLGKAVKGARIHVLGVAYKTDVAESRESPAIRVMDALRRRGALLSFSDPYIDSISVGGQALDGIDITQRAIAGVDCVAVLTPHRAFDFDWIADHAQIVFDARNAYGPRQLPNVVRL